MKKILITIVAAYATWWAFTTATRAPNSPDGILAGGAPEQTETKSPPWKKNGCEIVPLASYKIAARVLSKKYYSSDPNAQLAPLDLVLGWQQMSDSAVLRHISLSQTGRWYEYTYDGTCPVSGGVVATQSANVHCLPADPDVYAVLKNLRRNSFVKLEGYLVEVRRDGLPPWRSSLTRDDDSNGSCEIFWITSAREFDPSVKR